MYSITSIHMAHAFAIQLAKLRISNQVHKCVFKFAGATTKAFIGSGIENGVICI